MSEQPESHPIESASDVVCNHDSWDGLMVLLDEHWPETVFPTRHPDHPDRDPGPRIVSLIRVVDRLTKQVETLKATIAAMQLDRGADRPARENYLRIADELIQRALDAETAEAATAYHYAADRIIGADICPVSHAKHRWQQVLPKAPEEPYVACSLCEQRR